MVVGVLPPLGVVVGRPALGFPFPDDHGREDGETLSSATPSPCEAVPSCEMDTVFLLVKVVVMVVVEVDAPPAPVFRSRRFLPPVLVPPSRSFPLLGRLPPLLPLLVLRRVPLLG